MPENCFRVILLLSLRQIWLYARYFCVYVMSARALTGDKLIFELLKSIYKLGRVYCGLYILPGCFIFVTGFIVLCQLKNNRYDRMATGQAKVKCRECAHVIMILMANTTVNNIWNEQIWVKENLSDNLFLTLCGKSTKARCYKTEHSPQCFVWNNVNSFVYVVFLPPGTVFFFFFCCCHCINNTKIEKESEKSTNEPFGN